MVILGLTGSIGMGKTVAAGMFRRLGIPVHDADRTVHGLLAKDGAAVAAVAAEFPGAVRDGRVDRAALAGKVFGDDEALSRLEAILHPLVRQCERAFLRTAAAQGRRLVVLAVPLLFETGGERRCDGVVVVSAARLIQEARVLKRPGMTRGRLEFVLSHQMCDAKKCRRAEFVVSTGLGHGFSLRAIRKIVKVARRWRGAKWPPLGFQPRARPPGRNRGRRRS